MDSNSEGIPASVGRTKVVEPSPQSPLVGTPPSPSVAVHVESLPPFLHGAPNEIVEEVSRTSFSGFRFSPASDSSWKLLITRKLFVN